MVKEVSAGAIVYKKVNDQYLYLLVQQKNGDHFSFPKGHVEKNESIIDAAHREVYEETGIMFEERSSKVEVNTYLMQNGIYKDVYYFLGEASNSVVRKQDSEIKVAGWYTKDQVFKYLTYDNDKIIFIKLAGSLEK
ncbi:Predicted NTP pyrophosphohydrolase [Acholeplasma oculi]|uniref:Bis(5'-nucleosyl)-tetraphosphatase [asymmetrical] n=1 Tax=Acholeplasma oculi TaxID=35623 RepID=A0A061ABJ9_9MOLU|nr:NUDIX domain-containing protein [Acholeplasma oculi]CDR30779.1 DNA mistmatch repair protein MutT [Acholeplasma oculi]SKC34945.1 NUDIX domain-containing protein [Acholeplasma oculi]SUT89721.1 Predicted NTP pyrophosphohydrolase [Acholeplasma oculi]